MKKIEGGVCAAKGFTAGGIHVGIRPTRTKKDLALIYSEVPAAAAGAFTRNRVKAAPVLLDMERVENGRAQAIVVNSGIANACAPRGPETAVLMGKAAADFLKVPEEDVLVASTGVIGMELNVAPIEEHIGEMKLTKEGYLDAEDAIMTTDTKAKITAYEFEIGGSICHIGGIAKGSGMIHPNMGTMLSFITTDAAVAPAMLKKALQDNVRRTFNRISVDGDTSTNDSCLVLANGLAGNPEIASEGAEYRVFETALRACMQDLAVMMASDGEGASRLVTVSVTGAKDEDTAELLAKTVVSSSLTKAAMFGADANWGRVLCAMGYSGAEFDVEGVTVEFVSKEGTVRVCEKGRGLAFDEALAKKVLLTDEVEIRITLDEGDGEAVCWGCDLTYDYVKINGDYRS